MMMLPLQVERRLRWSEVREVPTSRMGSPTAEAERKSAKPFPVQLSNVLHHTLKLRSMQDMQLFQQLFEEDDYGFAAFGEEQKLRAKHNNECNGGTDKTCNNKTKVRGDPKTVNQQREKQLQGKKCCHVDKMDRIGFPRASIQNLPVAVDNDVIGTVKKSGDRAKQHTVDT